MFLDNKSKLCWRRVLGLFGWSCVTLAAFLNLSSHLWEPIFYGSCALIGLTTADLFTKKENL